MNLHPIIVHFPIACLVLYSMIEIGSIFSHRIKKNLETTKYFLLTVGVIWIFSALQSWEIAQQSFGRSDLIHTHEEFGEKSHMLYIILFIFYIIKLTLTHKIWYKYRSSITKNYESKIITIINHKATTRIIAIISLIWILLLSITGALWWAISHGPYTDPVVRMVYNLFM